jgi:hypothetical protein
MGRETAAECSRTGAIDPCPDRISGVWKDIAAGTQEEKEDIPLVCRHYGGIRERMRFAMLIPLWNAHPHVPFVSMVCPPIMRHFMWYT